MDNIYYRPPSLKFNDSEANEQSADTLAFGFGSAEPATNYGENELANIGNVILLFGRSLLSSYDDDFSETNIDSAKWE